MSKLVFLVPLLLVIAGGVLWVQRLRAGGSSPAAHAVGAVARTLATPEPPGPERVAKARAAIEPKVREQCVAAGLPYPPRELFLRAFKHEAQLEVWGRETDGPFKLITTHAVLAASGMPGPKRREGDRQVPEGFYEIDLWNPESKFHLSLRVNYPNESDRQLSDQEKPGSDIYVHGSNLTVGCLPLGDPGIEELYLLTLDVRDRGQTRIPIHIFPRKMDGADWEKFVEEQRAKDASLGEFWEQLRPGFLAFEKGRLLPEIRVEAGGKYRVVEAIE